MRRVSARPHAHQDRAPITAGSAATPPPPRRLRRAALVAAGALGLVASGLASGVLGGSTATTAVPCSGTTLGGGDWPRYGHDPANTRSQPLETSIGPARAASLRPAWVFSLSSAGDSGELESTPIVSDGCAFVTATNGGVYAVDASSGVLQWRHVFAVASPGLGGAFVGGAALANGLVVVLVNETGDGAAAGPHLAALDEHTGNLVWQSAPISTKSGYYTNATPQVIGGVVFAGFSPPEGDSTGQGGFALVDVGSGAIVKITTTVPPARQAQGFAGGGIWSTPAFDPATGFAYVGAGNPYSKQREDANTNAILKVDMRSGSPTFGDIVAAYKGNIDQYTGILQNLSKTALCAVSTGLPDPLDDPACGQLDLDFGASPNLFVAGGREVVGDLQKAGVYHVADAGSMAPVWNRIVGATCQACNATSTAFNGSSVIGESTPGGLLFGLARETGARQWLWPIADGLHYQSISVANGVVYTLDTLGNFDVVNAATGRGIMRRNMALDTHMPMLALTSGGVAIAYHTVFVAASFGVSSPAPQAGFLIAYR